MLKVLLDEYQSPISICSLFSQTLFNPHRSLAVTSFLNCFLWESKSFLKNPNTLYLSGFCWPSQWLTRRMQKPHCVSHMFSEGFTLPHSLLTSYKNMSQCFQYCYLCFLTTPFLSWTNTMPFGFLAATLLFVLAPPSALKTQTVPHFI